jgi:hypothetical protein
MDTKITGGVQEAAAINGLALVFILGVLFWAVSLLLRNGHWIIIK